MDTVEFLAKECHAEKEELGRFNYIYNESSGAAVVYLVTPLWCAAASNKFEVAKLLIDLGADINAVSDYYGGTAVHHACDAMKVDVAKFLIMHGANVAKPDRYGVTCLMNAILNVWNSHNDKDIEDMVQLLIDHGSNPYVKNEKDHDAFQQACHLGLESILQKLIIKFQPPARCLIEF